MTLKTKLQIAEMKKANQIVKDTLNLLIENTKEGSELILKLEMQLKLVQQVLQSFLATY